MSVDTVGKRGNRRLQIFDHDGKHLDTWYQFSRISGLSITAGDTLSAIDSESDDNYSPGWRKGLGVGGVTVDAAGNVYAGEVGADTP